MTVLTKSRPRIVDQSLFLSDNFLWRVTLKDYHAMIEAGIFTENSPIELIEGCLVTKMPKKPLHSSVTRLIRDALMNLSIAGWYVDSQEPITMVDSEPEPDVVVISGTARDYFTRHPYPEDVAIVVEVSDATLKRDQSMKKRLYASVNIPVYWVVNLPESQIEVYSDPSGASDLPNYRQQQTYVAGQQVPVVIDGQEIGRLPVADLLP